MRFCFRKLGSSEVKFHIGPRKATANRRILQTGFPESYREPLYPDTRLLIFLFFFWGGARKFVGCSHSTSTVNLEPESLIDYSAVGL